MKREFKVEAEVGALLLIEKQLKMLLNKSTNMQNNQVVKVMVTYI